MHKSELIDYIANQQSCTKVEATKIVHAFTSSVTSILAEGKEITLIGFGKFSVSQVAARSGRNPQTGETINIAAYVQPKFSAGSALKLACNSHKAAKPKGINK
jgi:DNA-binding protein HU-beta